MDPLFLLISSKGIIYCDASNIDLDFSSLSTWSLLASRLEYCYDVNIVDSEGTYSKEAGLIMDLSRFP